jgi:hypothetical protein
VANISAHWKMDVAMLTSKVSRDLYGRWLYRRVSLSVFRGSERRILAS